MRQNASRNLNIAIVLSYGVIEKEVPFGTSHVRLSLCFSRLLEKAADTRALMHNFLVMVAIQMVYLGIPLNGSSTTPYMDIAAPVVGASFFHQIPMKKSTTVPRSFSWAFTLPAL